MAYAEMNKKNEWLVVIVVDDNLFHLQQHIIYICVWSKLKVYLTDTNILVTVSSIDWLKSSTIKWY
jgi:hypothetical protein